MTYVKKTDIPYFTDCESLVNGLGYRLVNLSAVKQKAGWQIQAVVYSEKGVGIDDCSKVHRALLPRLEALLNSQDVSLQVSSPGINRNIKSTIEFAAFIGEAIAVWSAEISDWREGTLADTTEEAITIETKEGMAAISYADIKKAKLNKM
ncbi:ribosome maturation factor [Treponema phagedenis]|uniref:Ribosome maturation factor RimP n=1 Tax=Treponema phagedenis TaxID=162 RepID=A0A0B7GYX6_TREPH|nr:ribosome maturation factor RimP [Treponema phagedenis]EFW37056.1 hypothetical protein HMPREF9554_02448 [Treponema phagedenis F0421]NVP25268.1 ribosome maturation factor RimP [Treponema phagedenis]QEJ93977.1 ribosome maturation factor RimP [Treponema phagedenis]QEJ97055.1 ribosome maturation factor RimP [Treponema phagedenis]QEK02015.1 ribosome maturation factor RimP [Treponema phagedenis]